MVVGLTFAALSALAGQTDLPPFSAVKVYESTETLADGTHISRVKQKTLTFRDSQGRTRDEPVANAARETAPTSPSEQEIKIHDPVAGFELLLYPAQKTARRTPIALQPALGPSIGSLPDVPQAKHESLGTEVIEGERCDGQRMQTTMPVGSLGNDREIVDTTEFWISEELRALVLMRHTNLRYGNFTSRLTEIKRGEPDPRLFQIPFDYRIEDQPAPGQKKQ